MNLERLHSFLPNRLYFVYWNLGLRKTWQVVKKNLFSTNHYFVLQANLNSIIMPKRPRIKYSLIKAKERDLRGLERLLNELSQDDRKELILRLFFYHDGFRNCYMGVNSRGKPIYIQWILYPDENRIIQKKYAKRFYLLNGKQVMLENAFTFPQYRGMGLLPAISSEILIRARTEGYTSAITFIRKDQIVSINEFIRLGFRITKMVKEYKLLGVTKRLL